MFCITSFPSSFVYAKEKENETVPSGITYSDLNSEIENYIKEHESTTVGLAYSVVDQNGAIAEGCYGYADRENQIKVDEETVFDWGSGSKILVWLSVMKAYEDGLIDLDADISRYLPEDFLSNLTYDKALTMKNLMNHDAGFQDRVVNLSLSQPYYIDDLEAALSANKPAQIFEPGTMTAYSNWGTALAAYIVERVSGIKYYEYVHKNIFEPLGMEQSAVLCDFSDNEWVKNKIKELKTYDINGKLEVSSAVYTSLYPAGSCGSSVKDMKILLQALVNKDERILSKKTWETMLTPTDYFGDSKVAKNYHGLWAVYFGDPLVGHLGKTARSSCYFLVDLKKSIGSVFVCNQNNESTYVEGIRSLIYGEYIRENYGEKKELPEGVFRISKTTVQGPFKIISILNQTVQSVNLDGEYWDYSEKIDGNRIEFAYMDFYRVPDSQALLEYASLALLGLSIVLLFLSLVGRGIVRIIFRKNKEKAPLAKWSFLSSFLPLATVALYLNAFTSMSLLFDKYKTIFIIILVLVIIMAIMAIYGLVKNISANISKKQKIFNYFVVVTLIITVIDACYWNIFMIWKI